MKQDSELLRRYVEQGSQAAFGELVHQKIDLVYSAALRQVAGDKHVVGIARGKAAKRRP